MGRIPPVVADTGVESAKAINITAHELISAHGSPVYVLLSGFVAGALLWVPVYGILLFNRFMVSSSGARVGAYGGGLGVDPAALLPYMAATGLLGVGLAVLRRISARIGWYKEIASQRLGLNGVVASLLGAVICIGLIASGSSAGLLLMFISVGVFLGGFLVNALWEIVHNLLLTPYGARNSDALIERAVRHELMRSKRFRPKRLERVTVTNGKVTLAAEWENAEARQEAQEALRQMVGVSLVQFEKLSQ